MDWRSLNSIKVYDVFQYIAIGVILYVTIGMIVAHRCQRFAIKTINEHAHIPDHRKKTVFTIFMIVAVVVWPWLLKDPFGEKGK